MRFLNFLNKSEILSYKYCKKCGAELKYEREDYQFDRHLGIAIKYRFTRECPHYICFMGTANGHDHWDWTERNDSN